MQVSCTQCGGAIQVPAGAQFVACEYCGSALYLDRSRVVFHFVVTPTISLEEAQGKLRRWMAGNETIKDLDTLAVIGHEELQYFPMWRFVIKDQSGEREMSEPARPFAISDIKQIPLSGGDLKYFTPQQFGGISLLPPEVLLDSAIQWLQNDIGIRKENIKETNLIHIPFYLFKYQFQGMQYQAVIDGTSGKILATVYPAKAELPFVGIAALSAIVFLFVGLLAPNAGVRFLLYLVTAIPISAACYLIVRKY